jgi:sugar/nucleoside kinase (ribokinase family)
MEGHGIQRADEGESRRLGLKGAIRPSAKLMDVTFVIAGKLSREYVLPPIGRPLLDAPGGSALYACGGLLPWAAEVGLLGRVGEDYPRAWLKSIQARGIDVEGIRILPQSIDLREFIAYEEDLEVTRGSPVSQFARRKLPFPKELLGYQPPTAVQEDQRRPEFLSPKITEIPTTYRDARAIHVCPLDFVSHHQLISTFKASQVTTLTLDPSPGYMSPAFLQDLRAILSSLTAFLPSETKLRGLFWGQTYDIWEMMEAVGSYGCEVVAVRRGSAGQAVLDVRGHHRYEIPAYPARPADPTGAGDAYCGGFLAGYKRTYDPLQAALHANISASLTVEGTGAFYPSTVLEGLAQARLAGLGDLVRRI